MTWKMIRLSCYSSRGTSSSLILDACQRLPLINQGGYGHWTIQAGESLGLCVLGRGTDWL